MFERAARVTSLMVSTRGSVVFDARLGAARASVAKRLLRSHAAPRGMSDSENRTTAIASRTECLATHRRLRSRAFIVGFRRAENSFSTAGSPRKRMKPASVRDRR